MNYAVIMAGGSGARLWPRSRRNKPKQFHSLFSSQTLLQETVARLKPLFKDKQILVVVGAAHAAEVKKQLPHIPKENILEEPESKDTGPAILLAALHLHKIDASTVAVFLPSDHYIGQTAAFRQLLNLSLKTAKKRRTTVTLGIKPNYPETGYGYIELGQKVKEAGEIKIFKV
ncbi:NTP transferase domain-containing protein, partial [Candidatus Berkelbacteria bacterium]|nr:NTP transferase domain-containing protein [Candidatus Berkelbacteria bacterium]